MRDLKKKLLVFSKKHWPFGVIFIFVAIFFWKVFVLGWIPFPGDFVVGVYYPWLNYKWGYLVGVPVKNPIMADVPSFIFPMQMYAVELLKSGELPLWNPYILGGVPLLANFQSAPFSPTNLIHFIISDRLTAWSLQIMVQHFFAAIFTYLLLRYWRVTRLGSVVGGIIFAFGGYNMIWSQWNGHALAAAFIPLMLLFVDQFLSRSAFLGGLGISVVTMFMVLSGYPQSVIYGLVAVALLWLIRFRFDRKYLAKTIMMGLFVGLGFGLAGFQLLPGYELLKLSQWKNEGQPYEWAFLPWRKVITFVAPDYFGNHVTRNYWGPQDYTGSAGFVGIVATILVGFSVSLWKKSREILFLFLLLVVSVLLVFESPVSFVLWKNDILGMGSSSAARGLVVTNLSMALMAGFGFDRLVGEKKIRIGWVLLVPLLLLVGFGVTGVGNNVALRNLIFSTGVFLVSGVLVMVARLKAVKHLVGILVVLLLILEIFRFGWKYTSFSSREFVFPETPALEFLRNEEKPFRVVGSRVIPVNLHMPYDFEYFEGYETMRPALSSKFLAVLNSGIFEASPAGRYGIIDNDTSRLLDMVNTKYYLTIKRDSRGEPSESGEIPERFDSKRFHDVADDGVVTVLKSESVLPRAFVVYDWEVIEGDQELVREMLKIDFPIGEKVLLSRNINGTREKGVGETKYLKYEAMESVIAVKTSEDGLLFVSDLYYPGWKAYVDGVEREIYRANYAFRAVKIPKGEHVVKMEYRPESFTNGLRMAGASVIVLWFLFVGRGVWSRYTSLD